MNLQLIDNVLCEGRLYRASGGFHNYDARGICDLLFLYSIITYMLYQDRAQHDYAVGYADKTTQYSAYSLFRTHATDLYMLAYQVSNPQNTHIRLRHPEASMKFLEALKFNARDHHYFMRMLSHENADTGRADSYFMRLGSQLKIRDGRYHQWRREIVHWSKLSERERDRLVNKLITELARMNARGSEVYPILKTMTNYREYEVQPSPDRDAVTEDNTDTITVSTPSSINAYWSKTRTRITPMRIVEVTKKNANIQQAIEQYIAWVRKENPTMIPRSIVTRELINQSVLEYERLRRISPNIAQDLDRAAGHAVAAVLQHYDFLNKKQHDSREPAPSHDHHADAEQRLEPAKKKWKNPAHRLRKGWDAGHRWGELAGSIFKPTRRS